MSVSIGIAFLMVLCASLFAYVAGYAVGKKDTELKIGGHEHGGVSRDLPGAYAEHICPCCSKPARKRTVTHD